MFGDRPSLSIVDLKNKALYFLARREYGYKELYNRLSKYTDNLDQVKQIVDDLVVQGYLSEERFVKSYLNSKSSKFGPRKIRYDLLQKQVDEALVSQAIRTLYPDEYTAAYQVWLRKYGAYPVNHTEQAKQIRFLLSRGFSYDVVMKIVNQKS